jgi:hypothetical protein
MKFECGDLERALANPDLMPEAREHLKTCVTCRREFRLWTDITSAAREMHEEWESPGLWPRIQERLAAERKASFNHRRDWRVWALAAAAILIAVLTPLLWLQLQKPASGPKSPVLKASASGDDPDFLTEQALIEVEKSEAAYRKSIEQLARLAQPKLENASSAKSVNAQEKLLMLDSAIADTRTNVASNRFNLRLQTTLADLYREKQQTLRELLTSDQKN